MTIFVSYARVSTAAQGRSGLGLEAQEEAIRRFLGPQDTLLAPTYIEVESGKRSDRPELAKALAHAKLCGATLLVAKVDRLARNARFLLTLVESGVDVVFCDLPVVAGAMGKFLVSQMALMAELEAGLISERTKAALAAAKERGVKLGGYRGVPVDPAEGLAARRRSAGEFKARLAPAIQSIRAEGVDSLAGIARELNKRGIRTPRGGAWSSMQVGRLSA